LGDLKGGAYDTNITTNVPTGAKAEKDTNNKRKEHREPLLL